MAGKIKSKIKNSTKENTVGVIVAIVVLLTILLVGLIAIRISRSNNKPSQTTKSSQIEEEESFDLVSNAENSSVTAYVERGVTADEKHYSISMTISANNRTIRVLRGYQNIEDKSEGLDNNIEAYKTFLKALERYDFTKPREDKSGLGWREACPTQKSYRFQLNDGSDQKFDRWYTFCNGERFGDYGGRVNLVYTLFRKQFPNYNKVTSGLSL
ncbi:MAG: hypothetical protein H6799_03565 [Candidatus Nomurabacteria bacterium]|nr:MAG: hypothetical protein H6799_03565 [Candidatus Nomurabacteria bacterium]HRV76300.1 hypothetical protein [Candidatus Saccharimonadales bacterium]